MSANKDKKMVHDFWSEASCGEDLYLNSVSRASYDEHSKKRYKLEPFIKTFADFESARGKKVLEIGVGLGADHENFAIAGAELYGIDLTERAINHTRRRLSYLSLSSNLLVGDAENLHFPDETFDLVYSWGVVHHSPDTPTAVKEIYRVLKRGGKAKVMIYSKYSIFGLLLWLRWGLLMGCPWRTLTRLYAEHLESPGTKAYSKKEAQELFGDFKYLKISTPLTHADLLESDIGQRYTGFLLKMAKIMWPRWFIQKLFPNSGLFMLIEVIK